MTELYHGTDPMSDVISNDYRMLQMMSRFGITLGFADSTVEETCKKFDVHLQTFLSVVNYIKDPAHARIGEMAEKINLSQLISYLKNSHKYFTEFRLPGIRRKLIEALSCTKHSQMTMLILNFYDEYAAEVTNHMNYENEFIHPYVNELLNDKLPKNDFNTLAKQHNGNHIGIEKSIAELKSIILKYYPGEYNAQLMGEVLMDIFMTEEDLLIHCRMEDTLFAECVFLQEERVRAIVADEMSEEKDELVSSCTNAESISEREKQIIALVAKGYSNKKIADELFISINTVTTHRRNISKKLQIHSSAGLAVYAIANNFITIEDLQ